MQNSMYRDEQEWENQFGYERFVHDCISREKYAFMNGEKQGIQQGIIQGLAQGKIEKAVEAAVMLVRDFNITPELAAKKINAPLDKVLEQLSFSPV